MANNNEQQLEQLTVPTIKLLKCGHPDSLSHMVATLAALVFLSGFRRQQPLRNSEDDLIEALQMLFKDAGVSDVLPPHMRAPKESFQEVTTH